VYHEKCNIPFVHFGGLVTFAPTFLEALPETVQPIIYIGVDLVVE
jgi:hypothetical protein